MSMPIIIRCHSCGFVLYQGNELRSIDLILREWDYRCPVCMSPLSRTPLGIRVVGNANYKRIDDDEIKALIIDLLRKNEQLTTTELVDKVVETLGVNTSPLKDRVKEIIRRLERDGIIIRVGITKGRKIVWALKT
ncbi:MAG: hypothetical protein L7H10_07675 [Vulcanisaeta sp.]|nr:hypothetical protein [Vulcanisaeta sp.]